MTDISASNFIFGRVFYAAYTYAYAWCRGCAHGSNIRAHAYVRILPSTNAECLGHSQESAWACVGMRRQGSTARAIREYFIRVRKGDVWDS